jgi:ketosteroid isomerase-like protein
VSDSVNVELVRSIFAAFERGDYFSSADWADPEIELVIADGPEPGTWRGPTGMVEGGRRWMSAWNEWRAEVDEYRELDAERVLVLSHISARGKTSGLEIGHMQTQATSVMHIRDGKVTRWVVYFDRERALADLGLAPEARSSPS